MAAIFISYRRADSGTWTTRLSRHLGMRFGNDLVFYDLDDIKPGSDFIKTIDNEIKACEIFLEIIGPRWLKDKKGRRRLDDPRDILKHEISLALKLSRPFIPVLVGGASMPPAEELPSSIKQLSRQQAVSMRKSRWLSDMEELNERLRELIAPKRRHTPLPDARQEAYQLQLRYFEAFDHNMADALDLARKANETLDRVLPLYPQDSYLKICRGYAHKNEAMALRGLGRDREGNLALKKAEAIFDTMREEAPGDAGAWDGSGSVAVLQGKLQEAVKYFEKALQIYPDYKEAKENLAKVGQLIQSKARKKRTQ